MAVSTPNGRAIAVAMPTSSAVPTSAGATPPPVCPKRAGPFVKKSRFSACTPRENTDQTRTPSTRIAAAAAATAPISAKRFASSLRRLRPVAFSDSSSISRLPFAVLEPLDDPLGRQVRHEGDHEQDVRQVDQRRDLKIRRGPLVLIRNPAGHRVARFEDRE